MRSRHKVCMLGEGSVGKTSIVKRFVENKFDEKQKSTRQVAYSEKSLKIGNDTLVFTVFDTAGQEKYHSLAPLYYRDAEGIVLVYNITDMESFERIKMWLKEIKKFCTESVPQIIIVGNKFDLQNNRKVSKDMGEKFAKELENVLFIEASAKANHNVTEIFLLLAKEFLKIKKKNNGKKKLMDENLNVDNNDNDIMGYKFENKSNGGCCLSQ